MKKLTILTVATATLLTLGATLPTHAKAGEVKEGEKPFKEYMSEFEILNEKIEQLREYRDNLTLVINSRIKEFDNDNIFELDNEDFVENFYKELQDGGYGL